MFGEGHLACREKALEGERTPKRCARFGYARMTRQRCGVRRPSAAGQADRWKFSGQRRDHRNRHSEFSIDTVAARLRNERPIKASAIRSVEEPFCFRDRDWGHSLPLLNN